MKTKLSFIAPAFLISSLLLAALTSNNKPTPFLDNIDNFVLFAQEEARIEEESQVSSGNIGSNRDIDINKDIISNSDLFSDKITIDKDTQINGNAVFNKLFIKKDSQILGEQTQEVSLPIANIPQIGTFNTGQDNLMFQGEENTLPPGDYKSITLNENSRLTLTGGIYNIEQLELKNNSTLIFPELARLNIKNKLSGLLNISILPGLNAKPDDLIVNFSGHNFIHFGKQSFLNFNLLAPNAHLRFAKQTTFRGQIVAKRIFIAKDSVLSRGESFEKESDITKVVEDEGIRLIVNEIIILFKEGAILEDLLAVANLVDGRATGFLPDLEMGKIEVPAETIEELNDLINLIKDSSNPLIDDALPNSLIL